MSNNIVILTSSSEKPNVVFDEVASVITIDGVCMPENAVEMFEPVFDYLSNILKSKNELTLNIHLSYINSMSSKQLFKLLFEVIESEIESKINWLYSSDDELMKMKGEEIQSILDDNNFIIAEV